MNWFQYMAIVLVMSPFAILMGISPTTEEHTQCIAAFGIGWISNDWNKFDSVTECKYEYEPVQECSEKEDRVVCNITQEETIYKQIHWK